MLSNSNSVSYSIMHLISPVAVTSSKISVSEKIEMTVAVVICTRLRAAALRDCLCAISKLRRLPDQLIVVDNSLGDQETENLAREFSATYLVEPNMGVSRARNRGLSESNSDVVAYLDDDALPDAHWLDLIMEPFANPKVGVVTGRVAGLELQGKANIASSPIHLDQTDKRWFEIAAFGGLGIGANMALRRSACGVSDFFDERLGRGAPYHGMEEQFAFVRLLSKGYRAVHIPTAVVYHSSQNAFELKREARNHFAYSILLFSEFPDRRRDLLQFLFRRMCQKPLNWQRDAPDPGVIVSSNWRVLLKASLAGALLYFRTRKRKTK